MEREDVDQIAHVRRIASVVRLRPEKADEYRRLHAAVWPEVLAALKRAHIENYSIYEHDGLLFSYLEYTGSDLEADMATVAADEATQRWWQLTDPCQEAVTPRPGRDLWSPVEEVFHLD